MSRCRAHKIWWTQPGRPGPALEAQTHRPFGAVGIAAIDHIDAEIEGKFHRVGDLGIVSAGGHAEARIAAAAKPGDADPKPGAAQRGVILAGLGLGRFGFDLGVGHPRLDAETH